MDAREKLAAASKILLLLAPASQVGDQVGINRPAHLTRTRENYNPANFLSAVEKT